MKAKSTFVKASIFAVAMVLSLIMVISVLPAASAANGEQTHAGFGETLVASNINISGDITMMFYYTGLTEDNGYDESRDFVRVTVPTQNGYSSVIDYPIEDLDKDNGRWVVKVPVAYAQQTDKITMQWFRNGEAGKTRTRTVKDYADKVLALAEAGNTNYTPVVAPIVNMLNAGAFAQKALGHNTDKLANEGLFTAGNPVDDMLPEHFYDVAAKDASENTSEYITFTGGQVFLQSKVNLRIYVECPDDVKTATVSNGTTTVTVKVKKDDTGRKYVGINNIASTSFNKRFTVTLAYKGVEESFSYSVLDYAIDTLTSHVTSDAQKDVARALYLFYAHTMDYVDENYVAGPKDVACKHERTYKDGEDTVCADCGKTTTATKLNVAIVGNPTVYAGEETEITLAFSLSGDVNLSAIVFTPKCEGATFTLQSFTFNKEALDVAADNNFLVLNKDVNAALTAGEIATATYKITAPAGFQKISVAVREATDASSAAIDPATILSGIASVKVVNKECENHTVAYSIVDKDNHVEYCSVCGKIIATKAHSFEESKVQVGTDLIHKSACVCGSTEFHNAIPAGAVENPEVIDSITEIAVDLEAGNADGYYYKWTADKMGIYTFAVPADAAYTVTATANGITATPVNGYVSVYTIAGSEILINVKAVPVEGTYPAVDATVNSIYSYGTAGSGLAGGNTAGDTTVYCGQLVSSTSAEGVTYSYNGTANPQYSIQMNNRTENERYMAITYKSNGFVDTSRYYCKIYDVAAGTTAYDEGTRFNKAVTFINDNEWHTMIIDTWAFMNGTAKDGTTRDTMNGDYRLDSIRLDFQNIGEGASFTVKSIELSNNNTYLYEKYGVPCEHNFEWAPVNGKAYEQQVCSTCGKVGEEREAAFYLSPDNLRVDGTTTKDIVNNSGKNQTTGLGFSIKKSNPLVVNATDVFADGKYVTSTVGLGGWVVINGGAKTYVYRVNGGKWQEADCRVYSLSDGNTAHIELVENANLGIKDYYSNALLDSGIFTKDLQAEYGGQTVNIEFAAVPNNNPEVQIVFAKLNNIKVFKVNAVELGEFAVNTNGAVYQYTATNTGVYNVECPKIDGVSYNVTITNAATGETVTKTNAGGTVAGVDVKSGNVVTVLVTSDKTVKGTFNSTCYYGGYGANFSTKDNGNCLLERDSENNALITVTKADTTQVYFRVFDGANITQRYMALTYKTTDITNTSSVFSSFTKGETKYGVTETTRSNKIVDFQNDGEWHTTILDLYAYANISKAITFYDVIHTLRFDMTSGPAGRTLIIKGIEMNDDYTALVRKFNTPTYEVSGSSVDYEGKTNELSTKRDSDNNLVIYNNAKAGDNYLSLIYDKPVAGKYAVIVMKADTAATNINTIHINGIDSTGTAIGYKSTGSVAAASHVGEWISVVIDVEAYLGKGSSLTVLRLDTCEDLAANAGSVTVKYVAMFEDLDMALAASSEGKITFLRKVSIDSDTPVGVAAGDSNGLTFDTTANIIGFFNVNCPDMGGVKYNVTLHNVTKNTTVTSGAIASGNVAIESNKGDTIRVTVVAEPVDGNYPALSGNFNFSSYYAKYGSTYSLNGAANCETSRDEEGNYVMSKTGSGTPYFEVVCNTGSNTFEGRYLAITYKTKGCTGATGGFTKYYKADGTWVGWTDSTGEVTRYSTHITMKADTEDWQTVIIDTYDLMLYKGKLEEGAKLYAFRLDCGAMKEGESITFKGVEFHDDYEYLANKFDNVTYVGVN